MSVYFWRPPSDPENELLTAVKAYLQANYARDFKDVYRRLSSVDSQARSEARFLESQRAYHGFTLQAARRLGSFMSVWLVELTSGDTRMQIKVGYRVPSPADVADLLLNWDEDRLDRLPRDRQQQILDAIDARGKQGRFVMVDGQESFELLKEENGWNIFLDWASATTVKLTAELPASDELAVSFAESEVIAKDDELFLVKLVVKNRGARSLKFTVTHRVVPESIADELAMVECGLRTPVTLRPGSSQEFSMAYLLSAEARQKHRAIGLVYVFSLK
jgi:hypothetical protein